uniref:Peptidase M13 C-terminal domain-containing protein n=1 Tax=viral metagenome TaxID=1070528 RepID=A0A6C0I926_9ZZZZ
MPTKKHKTVNNKTKKCQLSKSELQLVCKNNTHVLESFEKDFEKTFKSSLTTENANIEKSLVKMFKTPFTPSKYTPRNDFYTYINYQWIEDQTKKLQEKSKYYVQVDSFRITQEKVYYELIDIVKEYTKANDTSKSRAIKNLYDSMLHLDNKEAEDQVKFTLKYRIDKAIENDNLYWLLAQINQNEVISWGCPIVWSVGKDSKHSSLYKSTISAPQLTIYDFMIYIDDPTADKETQNYKKVFKHKYLDFISTMFDECLGKGHGLKASDVWDAETDLIMAMGCTSVKKQSSENYNVVTKEESLAKYGFDWERLATEIGYKTVPNTFICTSLSYLKCIMYLLTTDGAWKTPKWRTYFMYIIFRQIMRFHSKWRIIYWEFHGKFISGQQSPWPDEIYPVFGLSLCFNTFLTNEYIRHNKKQEYIDYVSNLATDLLTVFKRILKRNTWLSPKTKKYALLKIEKIKLTVGNPIMLREDPILNYSSRGAYQNIKKIAWWRTKKLISLDGTASKIDVPLIDWAEFKLVGSQAYIVNAFYTPVENAIYIPLAYLQKPFIDLDERGIEYNLAHIGYTLGHEMSHSLDDTGSKYDYKGNLHNWWTPDDRRKFEAKVRDVAKQYETFAGYDGIKMDGTLSSGENLADISGLAICEEYLRDFQQRNEDIVPIKALSFEAFFVYVAIQARQKIADKAIKAQLKVNPHPMDKYRVNCPLTRLELFRSIYNIQKGDKMYWHSTDTIW